VALHDFSAQGSNDYHLFVGREIGSECVQVGGVEGPVKIDQRIKRAAVACQRFFPDISAARDIGFSVVFRELCFLRHSSGASVRARH
jgi:hypothetical protein